MKNHNWLVMGNGHCQQFGSVEIEEPQQTYRLYRFLTDLEDILSTFQDDVGRLQAIAPLVRKLLISSYWLQLEYQAPSKDTGWSVNFLYREHEFPLTVQMVAWAPGMLSSIHNHATWGIVAIVGGQERNQLWRRVPTTEAPHQIEVVGERVLYPGDLIAFTPEAIHSVEPLGKEPTVSFNLYGVTDYSQRYKFDPTTQTAELF